MDDSLEERLTLRFPDQLNPRQVERMLTHIARQFPARIYYDLITYKHIGTIDLEVPTETFHPKTDRLEIKGGIRFYYLASFSILASANGSYGKIKFDPAMEVEFPLPDWPDNFYKYIDEIKESAWGYLAQLEFFPDH